ncbi:adenylate/guanylate cyclase domain-containing protein [Larkinella soli]|uniref:adenylate/guanylate cyclase domain-containing protein n=1 Tax=Larkinella soli TaxID=1770527 RepID=UPI000FFCB174|nr:adenylate/guanylate cyclase domain-containing protein [Larkinella soli]
MKTKKSLPKAKTLEEWVGGKQLFALLFTDIIGSTRLCSEMGDIRWMDLLFKHFKKARTLLKKYDCFEVKIIGDSFMVVFNNTLEALKFALDFIRDTGDEQIKIRVGIHVGEARIIGNDIYGGMVNYASRVTKWHQEEGIGLSNSAKEGIQAYLGRKETEQKFIKVTHKFHDFDDPKELWKYNLDTLWDHRIKQEFPSLEEINEVNAGGTFGYSVVNSSIDDLIWTAQIEKSAYGEDAIPYDTLKEWYDVNNTGFFTIKDKQNKRVGHVNFLPVRLEGRSSFQDLMEGRTVEKDLKPTAIFSPEERPEIKDLYVESILINEEDVEVRTRIIFYMFKLLDSMLFKIAEPKSIRRFYAMAATGAGERFIRQLGFEVIRPSFEREDQHNFFSANYNDVRDNIHRLIGK